MNLVLVEARELLAGDGDGDGAWRVVLADGRATHLVDVLRVACGSVVRVGIVEGPMGLATVVDVAAGPRVTLDLSGLRDAPTPPRPRVDLMLCLPRPKVLARLLSPLAQLGIGRLLLTGAYRVEKPYFDAHILRPEEHRPLLVEGLAQAKDTRVPEVSVHRSFRWLVRTELASLAREPARRVYADPGASTTLREALRDATPDHTVLLAVGPEGGFTDGERSELEAHGFVGIGLGTRTLRTDVATIALLSQVHAELSR